MGGLVVSRRGSEGAAEDRVREQLGDRRIVVTLPFCSRPVCLPVMFRLVIKGTNSASRLWLARRMTEALAGALPGRTICVVADAAYAGRELRGLDTAITWTTRLRKDAAL
jgi:hypothetical protein